MRVSDWGLCIVGLCNLILYIGYILYIVKSLCDINGYVFTIERERRTGHPRVLSHGRSADTRRAMVFRGPASPECGAQRRFPVVMSSTTENARSFTYKLSVSRINPKFYSAPIN